MWCVSEVRDNGLTLFDYVSRQKKSVHWHLIGSKVLVFDECNAEYDMSGVLGYTGVGSILCLFRPVSPQLWNLLDYVDAVEFHERYAKYVDVSLETALIWHDSLGIFFTSMTGQYFDLCDVVAWLTVNERMYSDKATFQFQNGKVVQVMFCKNIDIFLAKWRTLCGA